MIKYLKWFINLLVAIEIADNPLKSHALINEKINVSYTAYTTVIRGVNIYNFIE